MIASISAFFQTQLDIVFFIYGLAFAVMGIAIFTQPRRQSIFKLGPILWLLGAFGLMHGINEWLDMWVIIKGQGSAIDLIRWFCLVISFSFLFEFSRRIFRIATQPLNNWQSRIASCLGWWLTPVLVIVILIGGWMAANFWQTGSSLARYLLAFPSGLLIAAGFRVYYYQERSVLESLRMRGHFIIAGIALLIYGLLGGLVVPKGDFFPANWLNNGSFLSYVGIPVQVFRAICAIATAWAMMRILTIFNWEITDKIQLALESQERVTEGIAESIMLLTPDFRILWANKALKDSSHLAPEEIIGNYCYRVTHHLDQPCQSPHDTCPIDKMIETGKPVKEIHTHYTKEGKEFYTEVTAYPVRNTQGKITQFVHVARDISDKVKAEKDLSQARQQLLQSEKLNALGQLAGGVAHDFNNILMIISGNTYLLKSELSNSDEDITKLLVSIEQAAKRGTDLAQKLLGFGRRGKYLPLPIDCNQLVKEISGMLARTVEKMIRIEQQLEPHLWAVEADAGQIYQVILNLCINAVQAMPDHTGVITIKTMKEVVDQTIAKTNPDAQVGKYVSISIIDTGTGMDKETLTHLFEPFFTTKKSGEGTGLGLAMIYGIVKNHGGFITVDSAPGKGSCFRVYLPASDKEASSHQTSHQIVVPPGLAAQPSAAKPAERERSPESGAGGAHIGATPTNATAILVVDDESGILEISRIVLVKHGYDVFTAKSGPEAVSQYQREKDRIKLVILDLIMPGWGGKETYAELKKINPDVKVLIASGYSIDGQAMEMIDAGARGFIQKPFQMDDLLKEIKRHIEDR